MSNQTRAADAGQHRAGEDTPQTGESDADAAVRLDQLAPQQVPALETLLLHFTCSEQQRCFSIAHILIQFDSYLT